MYTNYNHKANHLSVYNGNEQSGRVWEHGCYCDFSDEYISFETLTLLKYALWFALL